MIAEVAEREIDRWPLGEPFALAPRMSAVTLDVIMSGIFGIEGTPAPGTSGHRLRQTIRRLLGASTNPLFTVIELQNIGRREAKGILKGLLGDRRPPAVARSSPSAEPRPPIARPASAPTSSRC